MQDFEKLLAEVKQERDILRSQNDRLRTLIDRQKDEIADLKQQIAAKHSSEQWEDLRQSENHHTETSRELHMPTTADVLNKSEGNSRATMIVLEDDTQNSIENEVESPKELTSEKRNLDPSDLTSTKPLSTHSLATPPRPILPQIHHHNLSVTRLTSNLARFSFVPEISPELLPLKEVPISPEARKSMSFEKRSIDSVSPVNRSRKSSFNGTSRQRVVTMIELNNDDMWKEDDEDDEKIDNPREIEPLETVTDEPQYSQPVNSGEMSLPNTSSVAFRDIEQQSKPVISLPRQASLIPNEVNGRISILHQALLNESLQLEVISSDVRINQSGKEFTVYNISLLTHVAENGQSSPVEMWRIEKRYSDFLELHENMKQRIDRVTLQSLGAGREPPNKNVFQAKNGLAPTKTDKRRETLQKYLESIAQFESTHVKTWGSLENVSHFGQIFSNIKALDQYTSDHTGILAFLATSVFNREQKRKDRLVEDSVMEGYLKKRGKRMGKWVSRFFVIRNKTMEYYEKMEDVVANMQADSSDKTHAKPLGTIYLPKARISRQKTSSDAVKNDFSEYRHGLMITERLPGANGSKTTKKRTVLCAESDIELDEWLYYLSRQVELLRLVEEKKLPKMPRYSQMIETPNYTPVSARKASIDDGVAAGKSVQRSVGATSGAEQTSRTASVVNSGKYFDWGLGPRASTGSGQVPQPYSDNALSEKARVFGARLEDAIAYKRLLDGFEMPAVVYRCLEYLDTCKAHLEEGLYRLSGSSADMKRLRSKFEKEGDVDLLREKRCDIHVAAGLLKLFLREMPESILTSRLHRSFLDVTDLLEREDRLVELARLVSLLPTAQYTLLRTLIAHFIVVVSSSEVNKMTVRNVGIVFAPTLAIPAGIFILMITEFAFIFDVHEEVESEAIVSSKSASTSSQEILGTPEVDVLPLPNTESPFMVNNYNTDESKRMSWKADRLLVKGRSHRNSHIYLEHAPSAVKSTEQEVLQRDVQVNPEDHEEDEDFNVTTPTNKSASQEIHDDQDTMHADFLSQHAYMLKSDSAPSVYDSIHTVASNTSEDDRLPLVGDVFDSYANFPTTHKAESKSYLSKQNFQHSQSQIAPPPPLVNTPSMSQRTSEVASIAASSVDYSDADEMDNIDEVSEYQQSPYRLPLHVAPRKILTAVETTVQDKLPFTLGKSSDGMPDKRFSSNPLGI